MVNIDKDKLYQAYKQLLEEEAENRPRTTAELIQEIETVTGKTIAEIAFEHDSCYPTRIVFYNYNPASETYYAHRARQEEKVGN